MADVSEAQPSYAGLTEWCQGAAQGHVWADMLASGDGASDFLLAPMEDIISTLERVRPLRLERKRKDFRRDRDPRNTLDLRLELLLAYRLAVAGIPFSFGDTAQADVRCEVPGWSVVWLEVTSRARDDHVALHDELEAALDGLDVLVQLRIPTRRLKVPASDRQAICDRIRAAAEDRSSNFHTVSLPEVAGSATCSFVSPIGPSRIVINNSSELTEHYANVEQELRNVLAEKKKQAEKDGFDPTTILAVDASRLGLAWVRPDWVWRPILEQLVLDWEDIPFAGLLLTFTRLDNLLVGGRYLPRPDITVAQEQAIDPVLRAFGFTPDKPA